MWLECGMCPMNWSVNIWSPAAGTLWKGYKAFKRWSLAKGGVLLGVRLKSYSLAPLVALSLSPECKYNAFSQPPAPKRILL